MNHFQKIQHLYWRAGFGLSPAEWKERQNWTLEDNVKELLRGVNRAQPIPSNEQVLFPNKTMTKEQQREAKKQSLQKVREYNAQWVIRMGDPNENALLERMSLFWHGHFACESKVGLLAIQQLNSIRKHALGNFRELVLAMAKDPAMIRYLNNQQNRKKKPNENFARELLELFTIGRGNYTESDIKESARAFTGWSSDMKGAFVFRERQHDFGNKNFMGQSGPFDGQDIINIILGKRETATYIVRKIYRYFVNEKTDEQRVKNLADLFYDSDYDIASLMANIFSSDWFYDSANMGNKIKSPVELLAGMIRQLNISDIKTEGILGIERALGQVLFKPPNVAGWPGGKAWIDNSTLMMRLQFPLTIFRLSEMEFELKTALDESKARRLKNLEARIDFQPIHSLTEGLNEEEIFECFSNYLLTASIDNKEAIILRFVDKSTRGKFTRSLCIRMMSLPDYQLC